MMIYDNGNNEKNMKYMNLKYKHTYIIQGRKKGLEKKRNFSVLSNSNWLPSPPP